MEIQKLKSIRDNFISELILARDGQSSSLPYIKQPITKKNHIEDGEIFQTIVIGGSIFKKGKFVKNGYRLKNISLEVGVAPKFNSIDKFLSFIDGLIYDDIKSIALNFAYPMNPVLREELVDGILLSGSKENDFVGLVGKVVGDEIEKYYFNKHNKKIKISCANDTICLLLSSKQRFNKNTSVGGIIGTGINFAFFENDNTAINIESANFNKFDLSPTGRKINENSQVPGAAVFEKEVAGAYLYKHFNYRLKELNIDYKPITNSKDLSLLCYKDIPEVTKLAQSIINHSAMYCAAMIAGLARYKKNDIDIIMEGSLFWKGYRYINQVDETLKILEDEYEVHFINIDNSDTYGGANLLTI